MLEARTQATFLTFFTINSFLPNSEGIIGAFITSFLFEFFFFLIVTCSGNSMVVNTSERKGIR